MKTKLRIWNNIDILRVLDMSSVGLEYWYNWNEPGLIQLNHVDKFRQRVLAARCTNNRTFNN